MTTLLEHRQNVASKIAAKWFDDISYQPLTGDPVSCKGKLKEELQDQPFETEGQIQSTILTVFYLKEEIADSMIAINAYFTIDEKKYFIEGKDLEDNDALGRVIVNARGD